MNADVDELVNLKQEVVGVINAINNPEQRMVLELRYLSFKTWDEIAEDMHYGIDNIFKLHKKALEAVVIPSALQ